MKLKLNLNQDIKDKRHTVVFWACYMAFATTSFIFIVRSQIINGIGLEFGLSDTQKGEILGAGIWPLAISIVLFSLVIDDIGYGKSMAFGFICQVASGVILLTAKGYWGLYIGSCLVSLGNGAVQAVSDATVASMFKQNKTKWLNVFHSGWPMGMIIGGPFGVLFARMGLEWRWSIAFLFLPIIIYGLAMLGRKFPVHERVAAGVPYRQMLRESGAFGMLIVLFLVLGEICRVFQLSLTIAIVVSIAVAVAYWFYVRTLGRPGYLILLLLMIPLSTTEISTNSWIVALMKHELAQIAIDSSWVLIYASMIMLVLRLCAGPIIRLLSPLGMLAVSSLLAALGLVAYSQASGWGVFLAATLFAVGTTFLWPTMLGITAERYPRGGALSLNMITAVGQLSAGIVGAALLGFAQDVTVENNLKTQAPGVYAQVVETKQSFFGKYEMVDPELVGNLADDQKKMIDGIRYRASKNVLFQEALLPIIMFVSYVLLILYFRRKGGYQSVTIQKDP